MMAITAEKETALAAELQEADTRLEQLVVQIRELESEKANLRDRRNKVKSCIEILEEK